MFFIICSDIICDQFALIGYIFVTPPVVYHITAYTCRRIDLAYVIIIIYTNSIITVYNGRRKINVLILILILMFIVRCRQTVILFVIFATGVMDTGGKLNADFKNARRGGYYVTRCV